MADARASTAAHAMTLAALAATVGGWIAMAIADEPAEELQQPVELAPFEPGLPPAPIATTRSSR